MKTVQAAWNSYAQQVMPAGASDLQIGEGKLCFMAGASAMFKLVTIMAADMPEEKAIEFLSGLSIELQQFAIDYARTGQVP